MCSRVSPLSGAWRRAAPLPWRNHDIAAAALDGHLYVAGGLARLSTEPHPGTAFASLLGRASDTGRWSSVATLRAPRVYAATAAFAGEIWVLGGDEVTAVNGRRPTLAVESFLPRSRVAIPRPPLPQALPVPVAAAVGATLCVAGLTPGAERLTVYSLGHPAAAWCEGAAGPRTTAPIAGCADRERLYVAVPGESLWAFEPAVDRWRSLGGPAMPRSPQMACWRGAVWILGGRDLGTGREVQVFEPDASRWSRGPDLPEPLAWGAAAEAGGELFVMGGAWDDANDPTGWGYSDRTWVLAAPPPG